MSAPAPLPSRLGRLLGVEPPPPQPAPPSAPPSGPVRATGEPSAARIDAVRRPIEQDRVPVPPDVSTLGAARSEGPESVAAGVRRLLGAPRDARIAVAAAEVLAPPRALRPYRGPGGG